MQSETKIPESKTPPPPLAGWCPEDDTRDNVVARRNVLAALWAGQLMGLEGAALTAYAVEVHLADFTAPGDADVLDKLVADLHRAGLPARPSEIRARLSAFHREALLQTHATD
ncbi:ATPase inhibitor subunit zeta [uncultured Alsobacter sp.]|uniref:DUF1476 domain-containing protein n=1 Tax=uncultured Alsobacter sp. TaxID=1748258 RepID=UPI0025FCC843|nr:ATPase inhibitor subunit zeta [uncultured Alsobacter sp.]